jgi:hypothetical protein
MFRLVLEERKRREIDPTIGMLRDAVAELGAGGDPETRRRLVQMLDFFETADAAFAQIVRTSPDALRRLLRQAGKLRRLLGPLA